MCNTWRNIFLQSMNNTLSVNKLMKNLILRTLRQFDAVSEIIILIRWVTPPQKLKIFNLSFFQFWNSSVVHILQLCTVFTVSVVFLHWLYTHTHTQPNLFTNSSCAFYLKLVQNLHCVLVSWRICERNVKTYLIQNFRFCRSNRSASHEILIYSPTI